MLLEALANTNFSLTAHHTQQQEICYLNIVVIQLAMFSTEPLTTLTVKLEKLNYQGNEEHHGVVAKLVSFNLPVACLICTVYLTKDLNFPRKEVKRCPADKTMIPLARSLFSECSQPISLFHLKSLL